MEITKTTEKYNFYKEGENYILDLGNIKRTENRETGLLFTGIEDSKAITLKPGCQCTETTDKIIIDENTLSVKLTYNDCDATIAKTVSIKYNNVNIGLIKIKGKCQ